MFKYYYSIYCISSVHSIAVFKLTSNSTSNINQLWRLNDLTKLSWIYIINTFFCCNYLISLYNCISTLPILFQIRNQLQKEFFIWFGFVWCVAKRPVFSARRVFYVFMFFFQNVTMLVTELWANIELNFNYVNFLQFNFIFIYFFEKHVLCYFCEKFLMLLLLWQ